MLPVSGPFSRAGGLLTGTKHICYYTTKEREKASFVGQDTFPNANCKLCTNSKLFYIRFMKELHNKYLK
jgi:hypothetical protein